MRPMSAESGSAIRKVAIVGRLGVYPMLRLSLPARRIIAYLAVSGAIIMLAAARIRCSRLNPRPS